MIILLDFILLWLNNTLGTASARVQVSLHKKAPKGVTLWCIQCYMIYLFVTTYWTSVTKAGTFVDLWSGFLAQKCTKRRQSLMYTVLKYSLIHWTAERNDSSFPDDHTRCIQLKLEHAVYFWMVLAAIVEFIGFTNF